MNGTENRRSHITVCWNALEIIRILNASWKPAGRIRFVSIWHAMVLGFIHPRTGAYMEFEAPLPEYFSNLLLQFRKNV